MPKTNNSFYQKTKALKALKKAKELEAERLKKGKKYIKKSNKTYVLQ